MTHNEAIECLSDSLDNYGWYGVSWYSHVARWHGKEHPGTQVKFHHRCGDGCCSWSDDHFIEWDSPLGQRLASFFNDHPAGDEWRELYQEEV